ncbi:putative short chain oxidoreductase (CsgA) [Aspergillus fischeri NRRL 181]|uniref:Short chain oxidoreductase (CsgA), putative n=1 Tax=Neosartorya fischeri (strain ATCC 1020 / DSM 3700 / CBS 544.65 / FGSC A1164 / JCM 1740 / NRRL 181 / WB 181) TaxID=331117 RepID=A1CV63_NEOFI|nr:short chain oxidoreductase (CsgA), putative [Aspergillus fischeri NRRL 181]EAW25640.1 short chain oxidoreductase (CsgA), putative [Aspergillus fischeri NRRL 181]
MSTYLITGASRGLGLALVRHLANLPSSSVGTIFATSRSEHPNLQKLSQQSDRVKWVKCDVTDSASVHDAVSAVQGWNREHACPPASLHLSSQFLLNGRDDLTETFHTNVTGTHNVTRALLPLLREGRRKLVVNISTTLGSMTLAPVYKGSPTPAYKITKAALNMLTVQYAQDYASEGFTFLAVSPGWLQTEMGGSRADLPPATGAQAVLDIVQKATPSQNGKVLNIHVPGWEENEGLNQYDGKGVPW